MKRVEVAPRTPAWHAIRSDSWTASMAAVLVAADNAKLLQSFAATKGVTLDIAPLLKVGLDNFFENTLWSCWAEKTGSIPRFRGNEHTARGQENEVRVLNKFEQTQLIMVERDVTALSSAKPWLLASFDAMAPADSDLSVSAPYGFPVEAKCPAFQSRKKLWDSRKAGQLAVMGLPYYWCQVQHQIFVAEAPYGWFVAAGVETDPESGEEKVVFPIVEKVPRDDEFLTAYLAAAEFYHREFIAAYEEPPKLPSDHAYLKALEEGAALDLALAKSDHESAVEMYLEAVKAEAEAEERRKKLEAKVIEAANQMRAEGSDVVLLADRLEVSYTTGKTVSWQKVAKKLVAQVGLPEVPPDILAACESSRESIKLKERS